MFTIFRIQIYQLSHIHIQLESTMKKDLTCTKAIYLKVKKLSKFQRDITSNIKFKNNFIDIIKKEGNDLEKISIKKFPKIRKVLSNLASQRECILSRMTGSGSACFGMFSTKKSALLALGKIKNKFPGYWCVTAKSI